MNVFMVEGPKRLQKTDTWNEMRSEVDLELLELLNFLPPQTDSCFFYN
jgi:hypothetical protein